MPRAWKAWTEAEIVALRDGVTSGAGWPAIAATVGRSRANVQNKAFALGLVQRPEPEIQPQDREAMAYLREHWHNPDLTSGDISRAIGRPRAWCFRRAILFGLGDRPGQHGQERLLRAGNPWTAERTAELIRLWGVHDRNVAAVADTLGLGFRQVEAKVGRLGLARKTPRKKPPAKIMREWTPEQDALIRELWSQDVPSVEIARRIDCHEKAVRRRGNKLGLGPRPMTIARDVWRAEDAARLAELWVVGVSAQKIADELGMTVSRIRLKADRDKLRRPERVKAAPKPKPKAVRPPRPPASKLVKPRSLPAVTVPTRLLDPVQMEPVPAVPFARRLRDRPITAGHPRSCQWPFGDPGEPGFHFCGAATHGGYSYCHDHAQIAYRAADEPPAEPRPWVFKRKVA